MSEIQNTRKHVTVKKLAIGERDEEKKTDVFQSIGISVASSFRGKYHI